MASKCFILAFGGTGARCVEALTYLTAAGVHEHSMHVLLVDPDENNGNTGMATEQMQRYHRIHSLVDPAAESRSFFRASLNIPSGDDLRKKGGDTFVWKYGSAGKPWRELLDYSSEWRHEQGDAANGLYELLYSADDMKMTFEEGYVGKAHIGSLDILKTFQGADDATESRALGKFLIALEEASKNGAHLLVVGSIFGGTGASGIPAIPPFIREHRRFQESISKIRIGSVQLAPYFSFATPDKPDMPDSRLHPLVTQSALFHYGTTPVGYDRVYLIGAPELGTTNEKNARGGDAQTNRAHFAEVAAALAACHFFDSPPAKKCEGDQLPPVFASYSESSDYSGFPFAKDVKLRQKLITFATSCAFHVLFADPNVKNLANDRFMLEMKRQCHAILEPGNADLATLTTFSRRFLSWLVEVRGSAPELLTQDFVSAVRADETTPASYWKLDRGGVVLGKVAPSFVPGAGEPYSQIVDAMNAVKRDSVRQSTPIGFYIDLLGRTVAEVCKSRYSAW